MLIDSAKIYTYKDYLTFDEGERIEIINGQIYNMSPAPFDVILKNDDEVLSNSKNIVQPNISVICDKSKLTDKGCIGSPDMIVEVISPFNPSNDYVRKLNLYEQFKVKEYWIVNPMRKNILVYTLTDNGYDAPISYTFQDKIKVNIYDNLEIDFNSIDL